MARAYLLLITTISLVIVGLDKLQFSPIGFYILLFLGILSFVVIPADENFIKVQFFFYMSLLLVILTGVIRVGFSMLSFSLIIFALIGEFAILIMAKPKRRRIVKEFIIDKSKLIEKEIPKEEPPRVIITEEYIASKNGKVYHAPDCYMVKNIKDKVKYLAISLGGTNSPKPSNPSTAICIIKSL